MLLLQATEKRESALDSFEALCLRSPLPRCQSTGMNITRLLRPKIEVW